jgi:hypothetical protein
LTQKKGRDRLVPKAKLRPITFFLSSVATPPRTSEPNGADEGAKSDSDGGRNNEATLARAANSNATRTAHARAHARFHLHRDIPPARTFDMTTRVASLRATPRACGGFASRHALTGPRVPALRPRASPRPAADTTTRASTAWTLDGPGCAGARSGSTLVGYGRLPSGTNNAVPVDNRGPPRRCPLRPVAISDLCESHLGRFKMLDAVFEQEGDVLYVRHAERTRNEDRSGAGDAVGYAQMPRFLRKGVSSRGNFGNC